MTNYKNFNPDMMFEVDRVPLTYWAPLFLNEQSVLLYAIVLGASSGIFCVEGLELCRKSRRILQKLHNQLKKKPKEELIKLLAKILTSIYNLLYSNLLWLFFGLGNASYLMVFVIQNFIAIYITLKQLRELVKLYVKKFKLCFNHSKWSQTENLHLTNKQIKFIISKLITGWIPRLFTCSIWLSFIHLYTKVLPSIFETQFKMYKSTLGVPLSFFKNPQYMALVLYTYLTSLLFGILAPKYAKIGIRVVLQFIRLVVLNSIRYISLYLFYTSSFFVSIFNENMLKNYLLITEDQNPSFGYRLLTKIRFWLRQLLFQVTTIGLDKRSNCWNAEYDSASTSEETDFQSENSAEKKPKNEHFI